MSSADKGNLCFGYGVKAALDAGAISQICERWDAATCTEASMTDSRLGKPAGGTGRAPERGDWGVEAQATQQREGITPSNAQLATRP